MALFRDRTRRVARAMVLAAMALALGVGSLAAEEDQDAAIESARKGLGGWSDYPWYDASADDLKPLNVKPPKAPPKRAKPRPTGGTSMTWDLFQGIGEIVRFCLYWIFLPLLVIAILYFVYRAFLEAEEATEIEEAEDEASYEIDRIESLPTKIRRPVDDLLSESKRLAAAGNYREALIYLYSFQLVQLDKRGLIGLARGKTNRQYLREIATRRSLRSLFEPTMIVFEDVFFGGRSLSSTGYEHCQKRLEAFQLELVGDSP